MVVYLETLGFASHKRRSSDLHTDIRFELSSVGCCRVSQHGCYMVRGPSGLSRAPSGYWYVLDN